VFKKTLLLLLATVLLAFTSLVDAQQTKKVTRIGYSSGNSVSVDSPRVEAFRQGLRALGHVEGQNITIEYRSNKAKVKCKRQ
jgi:putative ABC transport system substrate-binding protein